MHNIPFHIAYLLTRYKYVIVPGLGSFIVSSSDNKKSNRWGIFSPPQNILRFSSDINREDDLLANSIAKREKCSVEEANRLIAQYVTQVSRSLEEGKGVYIPWVGSLFSSNNRKLFQAERLLSCNASNYGLTNFSMPYTKDIQPNETQIKKRNMEDEEKIGDPINWKKIIIIAVAISAAIIALFAIRTLLKRDDPFLNQKQPTFTQASAQDSIKDETDVSDTTIHTAVESVVEPQDTTPPPPKVEKVTPVASKTKTKTPAPAVSTKTKAQAKATTPHYYIIISSFPELSAAKKKLAELRSKGFKDADIISANGRHRIYSKAFENKADAEKYLTQFRKDNPALKDAWVLTVK